MTIETTAATEKLRAILTDGKVIYAIEFLSAEQFKSREAAANTDSGRQWVILNLLQLPTGHYHVLSFKNSETGTPVGLTWIGDRCHWVTWTHSPTSLIQYTFDHQAEVVEFCLANPQRVVGLRVF